MDDWVIVLLAVLALVTIVMIAVMIRLLVRLVKSFKLLRSGETPLANKVAFWGALIYTICPIDLLPDPIYLDDIGILLAAIHYLDKAAREAGIIRGENYPRLPTRRQ
jgi:uncharacterized membrane protein YkvA (DUF1232 family)